MLVRSRWLVFHLHLCRRRSREATNVAQQYLERQSRFRRTFSGKIYTLKEFLQVRLASFLCYSSSGALAHCRFSVKPRLLGCVASSRFYL